MRLVLDTNVVISAFIGCGAPYQLLQTASRNLTSIHTSTELLSELDNVLHRQKLASRLHRAHLTADSVMHHFRRIANLTVVSGPYPRVASDPKDDMVLACAVAAQANLIASGDKDLLALNRYQNISIMSTRSALQKVMFRSGFP